MTHATLLNKTKKVKDVMLQNAEKPTTAKY